MTTTGLERPRWRTPTKYKYLTHRDILLAYFRNTEAPLSLKNILYGDIQENMTKTLIAAVEQYICETQRFSILSLCE